jgi:hypothetical protein
MTAWTNFVTKIFKNGRKKDKNFQLGDAMKEASAKYKKGGNAQEPVPPEQTPESRTEISQVPQNNGDSLKKGGKKNKTKTKKAKKGGKIQNQKSKKRYSKRH